MDNLLNDTSKKLTFDQYAVSDHWVGATDANGNPVLSTSAETVLGTPCRLELNLAANLSADVERVTVAIVFGGESIGSFAHEAGCSRPTPAT